MLRSNRISPFSILSLIALGIIVIGAEPLPLTAAPRNLKAGSASDGAGEAFREVIPTELQQQVTVKPTWLPLSKQLTSLQDATKVPLTRAPSVHDDPLFVAASGCSEFVLLHQMRLLLTDNQWQCQWANKDMGKDHHSYRLWREAVSPQERRDKMARAAKDRLAKVLALIQAGPQAWDEARQEDLEMSNAIRQPIFQAPLLLAGQLSPEQLDGVLAGNSLTLRVADMSPQNQDLVRQSVVAIPSDDYAMQATNNITGQSRITFDMRHLPTSGEIMFQAQPLGDDSGTLGLSMIIFTEPEHEMGAGGSEMLYPNTPDFAQDEKQQVTARHEQAAVDALAKQTPGTKTVTIDAGAKPEVGEPQLAAYLRAFAQQTKLTVLAYWPPDSQALTDSKGLPTRLPASIVNKPAGEALDILCKTYGGEWVQDETTVRLRALPIQEPILKKPVASAVPAPPSPQPMNAP